VNRLLGFGAAKKVPHWHIRYLPLCFVDEKYHCMVSETHEKKAFQTEHLAPDFYNEHAEAAREKLGRQKIAKCKGCRHSGECEGYWKEYVRCMRL
jgi:hypothetical protein